MSCVLLAAAPRVLPEGVPGALVLLLVGMTVVFAVLGGLTLLIWFIGRVARDRTAEAAVGGGEAERGAPVSPPAAVGSAPGPEAQAGVRVESAGGPVPSEPSAEVAAAAMLEPSGRTVPAGGPFSSAELAAVGVAVEETIRRRAAGMPEGAGAAAVRAAAESPGAGVWGAAAFAGRPGTAMPVLRRG